MSDIYVVDASVAVKWFVPEEHHEAARRLRNASYELHAPDYMLLEVANVLSKKVRSGDIDAYTGFTVLKTLSRRDGPIMYHSWRNYSLYDLYHRSLDWQCSVYDYLYLGLARRLDGELVTADGRLYRGIKDRGLSESAQAAGLKPWTEHLCWVENVPA